MLNWSWFGSTWRRLQSQEGGSLFFHPLQFPLEPTGRLEQFGLLSGGVIPGDRLDTTG